MATYPDGVDFSTFAAVDVRNPLTSNGQVFYGGSADLDASWTPITGVRAVLEHIARRLITPPGMYDDPEYGFDLNSWLNASLLPQELDSLEAAARNEALACEGVDDCVVAATLDRSGALTLNLTVTLTDQVEGYQMVFVLSADTIPRIYFPTVKTTIV